MVGGGECWAAVGHEVSPGCTPQHDVPHPNLVMMQTKIITLMWMSCFNVHILICDGPKSDKFRLCIVTFYHSGNEFSFTKVRRLEEDMDKASCIARRKLLCREWTVEEIRFIHENLAVLKHDAQSFTKLPSPSPLYSMIFFWQEKSGSPFSQLCEPVHHRQEELLIIICSNLYFTQIN